MIQRVRAALGANRKVALFLSGQAISLFGSSLVQFALMWSIVLDTDSGMMAALYTTCSFAPQIVISLLGGAWADRYNRKKLIIYADAGIALATLVLCGLMTMRDLGYAPIFIIAIIRSLGGGIQGPAVSAVLPQLVNEDQLVKVNSINGVLQSLMLLLAPAAAALVITRLPLPAVLLIDVATAIVGIGIILPLKIPMHERTDDGSTDMLKEVKAGFRYAIGLPFLRRMFLYSLIINICVVPAAMFTPLFVTRAYGSDEIYLMVNEMVFFVGSLVGGTVMAAWGGFKNRVLSVAFGVVSFGFAAAVMGLTPPFWLYLVAMLYAGLTMPMTNAPLMALMQEKVQPDMMGRVFGLVQILSNVVMMAATLIFGVMSDQAPLGMIITVTGLGMALLGFTMTLDKSTLAQGLPKGAEE